MRTGTEEREAADYFRTYSQHQSLSHLLCGLFHAKGRTFDVEGTGTIRTISLVELFHHSLEYA